MRLQGQDIDRIAHYLLRDTRVPGNLAYTVYRGDVWEGLGSDTVKPERAGIVKDFALASLGNVQHHTAIKYEGWLNIATKGRYTFFLQMNGAIIKRLDNSLLWIFYIFEVSLQCTEPCVISTVQIGYT